VQRRHGGGRPKRSLGQNFLVDSHVARRIAEALELEPGETVLEIGPGRGALTPKLLEAVKAADGRLVLVELDDELAAELARRYGSDPRVRVLHRDILTVTPDEVAPEPGRLKVVGNIPYNITSPILFHLLDPPRPREILLMLQREVADRLVAEPGTKAFGALTVGVRSVAGVREVLRVPPGAFRPRPRVHSTVVRIEPHDPPSLAPREEERLRDLTRALFQWRRKQLGKILRDHPELRLRASEAEAVVAAGGAELTDRPETVSPEGFISMAAALPDRAGGRRSGPEV
jgi:16S rRNA (adenine1518-N6/adenine1519-N6)-dimethyltransferase